jgi:hypothetical protein
MSLACRHVARALGIGQWVRSFTLSICKSDMITAMPWISHSASCSGETSSFIVRTSSTIQYHLAFTGSRGCICEKATTDGGVPLGGLAAKAGFRARTIPQRLLEVSGGWRNRLGSSRDITSTSMCRLAPIGQRRSRLNRFQRTHGRPFSTGSRKRHVIG